MSRFKIQKRVRISDDEELLVFEDFKLIKPLSVSKDLKRNSIFCEKCSYLLISRQDVEYHTQHSMCIECSNNLKGEK
mgnify:CR=1 FL=1